MTDDAALADLIRGRYWRRDGTMISSTQEWAALLEDPEYKIVKQTKLRGRRKWVSTVWLGLNHNYSGGTPLIFETMVFGLKDLTWFNGRGFPKDLDQRRYTTEAEAIAGHAELCHYWTMNRKQRRKFLSHVEPLE